MGGFPSGQREGKGMTLATQAQQTNSLSSVIKFLNTQAHSYEDLSYEPTFKSSAMFPILCRENLRPSISFMNYWRYKNKIHPVCCLLTLRDQQGQALKRSYFQIEDRTYTFHLTELLTSHLDSQGIFVGSCELEFQATQDLKFPYPAVSIFYESPQGVSSVHMASRVFHSIRDMDLRAMPDVQETGFDIYATETWMPYFCFTNGTRDVSPARIIITVFNSQGQSKVIEIRRQGLLAYETAFVFFDESSELKEFMGSEPGFCKVQYDHFGIFPRLLCGNIARDFSHIAITHSYYDVSRRQEYFSIHPSGQTRSPFRAIPLLFHEGIDLDVNLYPIYSPGMMWFNARVYDGDGKLLAHIERIGQLLSPSGQMLPLCIRDLIHHAGLTPERCALLSLEGRTDTGQISSRINFGVNYYRQGKIGTNVNISMHHDAEFSPTKKRSYRWFPVFLRENVSNYVLLSVLSYRSEDSFTARVSLTLMNSREELYRNSLTLANTTSLSLRMEDLIPEKTGRLEGEILWGTLEADTPYLTAYYLTSSDYGFVGGDHSY